MLTLGGNCGLALIKSWPLQNSAKEFEAIAKGGKPEQGWTDVDCQQDLNKLKEFWERLGFEQTCKTPYAAFPHYRPLPTLAQH